KVGMEINIFPEGYGNFTKWYIAINNLFLERNNEPLMIEDIDWDKVNRNGNIFYVDIKIKKYRDRIPYEIVLPQSNTYELGFLEKGNYTFIVYVNGKLYSTREFIGGKIELTLDAGAYPLIIWNGEEWIARVKLCSNRVPKGIHWGEIEKTEDGFEINVIVEEWVGPISEHCYKYGEYNYSLGILPEGVYWFHSYINGSFGISTIFKVSRILTTFIETYSTVTNIFTLTEAYAFSYTTFTTTKTVTDIHREGQIITTYITIKVKEKSEETNSLTTKITKTIQTSEIKKEEFKIEQFTIPIFLFIIVIMIIVSLYYILFKRREI
ncbi:MAG: hypothetical protein QXX97_02650, partial [Nitrososphaerota archaeon]